MTIVKKLWQKQTIIFELCALWLRQNCETKCSDLTLTNRCSSYKVFSFFSFHIDGFVKWLKFDFCSF